MGGYNYSHGTCMSETNLCEVLMQAINAIHGSLDPTFASCSAASFRCRAAASSALAFASSLAARSCTFRAASSCECTCKLS